MTGGNLKSHKNRITQSVMRARVSMFLPVLTITASKILFNLGQLPASKLKTRV